MSADKATEATAKLRFYCKCAHQEKEKYFLFSVQVTLDCPVA